MSDQNNNNKEISSSLNLNAKRDQYTQEIRKEKREEIINTNREKIIDNDNKMEQEEEEDDDQENAQEEENSTLDKLVEEWRKHTFSETDFEDLVNAASSEDKLRQLYGFVGLTKLAVLDPENIETTVQSFIDCNIPDVLIKALTMHNKSHLQREATNLIALITCGNEHQIEVLLDKGVLPCLFGLFKSESEDTLESLFAAIGCIADNPLHRDIILTTLGLDPLIEAVNKATSPKLIKLGALALSNLCRGRPLPDINLVEQAIPTLSALFLKEENVDVLSNTAWALAETGRSRLLIMKIMKTNIIPKLIQHMDHQADTVSIPCLRIIGTFWELSDDLNDVRAYGPEFVPKLFKLLHSPISRVRKEVCWIISNITAGRNVNLIFGHPYSIDIIIRIVKTDIPEVVNEAVWVLAKVMENLDKNKIVEALDYGVLDCFLETLDDPNPKTVQPALEGIFSILKLGLNISSENGSKNELLSLFNNKGGLRKLEDLKTHKDHDLNRLACNILKSFYDAKDVV